MFGIVSSMINTYDTVFFDWGGVVADDPGDEFLGDLLRHLGATESQIQEIFQNYMKRFMRGQISESEYWTELKTNYGFSIPDTISQEFMKWTGLRANEDILDLVAGDVGNDRAFLWHDFYKPFSFQLEESLPYRDSANAEGFRQRILA